MNFNIPFGLIWSWNTKNFPYFSKCVFCCCWSRFSSLSSPQRSLPWALLLFRDGYPAIGHTLITGPAFQTWPLLQPPLSLAERSSGLPLGFPPTLLCVIPQVYFHWTAWNWRQRAWCCALSISTHSEQISKKKTNSLMITSLLLILRIKFSEISRNHWSETYEYMMTVARRDTLRRPHCLLYVTNVPFPGLTLAICVLN